MISVTVIRLLIAVAYQGDFSRLKLMITSLSGGTGWLMQPQQLQDVEDSHSLSTPLQYRCVLSLPGDQGRVHLILCTQAEWLHGGVHDGDTLLPMTPQAVLAQKYRNAQQPHETPSNNAGNPVAIS